MSIKNGTRPNVEVAPPSQQSVRRVKRSGKGAKKVSWLMDNDTPFSEFLVVWLLTYIVVAAFHLWAIRSAGHQQYLTVQLAIWTAIIVATLLHYMFRTGRGWVLTWLTISSAAGSAPWLFELFLQVTGVKL